MLRWIWAYHIKHRAERWGDRFTSWVAWHLPACLVSWCYVRVGAYATSGDYSGTVVPELGMMEALQRWSSRNR